MIFRTRAVIVHFLVLGLLLGALTYLTLDTRGDVNRIVRTINCEDAVACRAFVERVVNRLLPEIKPLLEGGRQENARKARRPEGEPNAPRAQTTSAEPLPASGPEPANDPPDGVGGGSPPRPDPSHDPPAPPEPPGPPPSGPEHPEPPPEPSPPSVGGAGIQTPADPVLCDLPVSLCAS